MVGALSWHTKVATKLNDLVAIIHREIGLIVDTPRVTYRLRGTSAGRARYQAHTIDLNPILLRDNGDTFVDNTVPHEFAHLITHRVYGTVQFEHGKEWQQFMRMFGVKPRVTHDYDLSKIVPTFAWYCACSTHQVPKRMHQQLIEGTQFECKACKQLVRQYQESAPMPLV